VREIIANKRFLRALRKFTRKHPEFTSKIQSVLAQLSLNPFQPALETHALSGTLEGSYACSVAYDLRIIFQFEARKPPEAAAILLLDIGTHDQVYK
jgi:mRNA interferase YafQ